MPSGYPQGRDQRGKTHSPTSSCRDCKATVLWATTPSGKRIPFDMRVADPAAARRVYALIERIDDRGEWRMAVMLHDEELAREIRDHELAPLAVCHFDTCPKRVQPRERADLA